MSSRDIIESYALEIVSRARSIQKRCENLSAGWFGHILISPGFSFTFEIEKILVLIRSLLLAIIFMLLAVMFDKFLRK